jgi:hypothetical protein
VRHSLMSRLSFQRIMLSRGSKNSLDNSSVHSDDSKSGRKGKITTKIVEFGKAFRRSFGSASSGLGLSMKTRSTEGTPDHSDHHENHIRFGDLENIEEVDERPTEHLEVGERSSRASQSLIESHQKSPARFTVDSDSHMLNTPGYAKDSPMSDNMRELQPHHLPDKDNDDFSFISNLTDPRLDVTPEPGQSPLQGSPMHAEEAVIHAQRTMTSNSAVSENSRKSSYISEDELRFMREDSFDYSNLGDVSLNSPMHPLRAGRKSASGSTLSPLAYPPLYALFKGAGEAFTPQQRHLIRYAS